jgi:hypothetical protein
VRGARGTHVSVLAARAGGVRVQPLSRWEHHRCTGAWNQRGTSTFNT